MPAKDAVEQIDAALLVAEEWVIFVGRDGCTRVCQAKGAMLG